MLTGSKMKWLLIFVLLIGCLFTACDQQRQKRTIDMVVMYTDSEFWQSTYQGAKAAGDQYGAEVKLYGATFKGETTEQSDIFLQSVERHPDAIIVGPRDYELMADPIEKASQAGIPVILLDSSVNSDQWVSLVMTDNVAAGKQLAEEMITRLGEKMKGKVGIVNFSDTAKNAQSRETAFRQSLQERTALQPLETIQVGMDLEQTEQEILALLEDNPDMVALAGMNAPATVAACRALQEAGRKDIMMVGFDCTEELAQSLEDGILNVVVMQQPYLMGYYCMEMAMKHLKGESVERTIYTETYVIDKSNLFTKESQQLIFPFQSNAS